jgi:hypothetical protein
MNKNILLDKIKKLESVIREEDSDEVRSWKKQVEKSILIDGLKENDGIKLILDRYTEEIKSINEILVNADSETLSDKRRDMLIQYKKMCLIFMEFFIDKDISGIEEQIINNQDLLQRS